MSQAPHTNVTTPDRPSAAPSSADALAEDHLARLHKMSTTAGVTNLDYVAVNHTAIVAVVLGLLSLLAFLGYLLFVIPVAGAVVAVIALRQIADSNGTQTGRGLAWLGLLLCVGIGGVAIGKEVFAIASVKGDESQIASRISDFGGLVREHKYKQAYDLLDPELQARVPFDAFQKRLQEIQAGSLGQLEIMEWNRITPAFTSAEGHRLAGTKMRIKFAKGTEDRFDVVLREVDGQWKLLNLPEFFPQEQRPPAGQRGGSKSNDVFNF